MAQFTIEGHEVIDRTVSATGNGAHIYVPKDWRGANVKIIRTSELENNE